VEPQESGTLLRTRPSEKALLDQFEKDKFELSTRHLTSDPSAALAEAQFRSKQILAAQERRNSEMRGHHEYIAETMLRKPDDYDDEDKDNRLVPDPALQKDWKKRVKKVVKTVRSARQKSSSTSSKSKSSKKSSPTKSAARRKRPKVQSTDSDESPVDVGDDTPLTFAEGSPEDLAMFGVIKEEVNGENGPRTILKPRLLRRHLVLSKQHHMPSDRMEPDQYLEFVRKRQERETQQYLDTYNQDNVSRPPIPTSTYTGTFSDTKGSTPATVDSMSTWLSLKTRGVRFEGTDGMEWAVRDYLMSQDVASHKFAFHDPVSAKTDIETSYVGKVPVLDKFKLDFAIPVKYATVSSGDALTLEEAKVHISTRHTSSWQSFAIKLELPSGEIIEPDSPSIAPNGFPTSFDEQMKQIQHKLPAKSFVKSCWNCALSEYSPIQQATFGGLGCFRQWPGISNVRDKMELLRNFKKHLERVQETHLCDSFVRRTKPRIPGFNPELTPVTEGVAQRERDMQTNNVK
jgi:hypothetical protein